MKRGAPVEDVVIEACGAALAAGDRPWAEIRKAVRARIAALPEPDRAAVENELRLMISRDEDQIHDAARH